MDATLQAIITTLPPATLRELLLLANQQLAATTPQPEIVGKAAAVELDGRTRMAYAVPQWSLPTADGGYRAQGVTIRAWSYRERREAETAALIRQGPRAGQVDDWRRMLEEVARGIVDPPELSITTIERWGYAVVTGIHAAIERLGDYPPALIAANLAELAGGPPPAHPDDPLPDSGESDPAELGEPTGA